VGVPKKPTRFFGVRTQVSEPCSLLVLIILTQAWSIADTVSMINIKTQSFSQSSDLKKPQQSKNISPKC